MKGTRRVPVIGALADFLAAETSGAFILLAATAVALVWANSPAAGGYATLWETDLAISLAGQTLISLDLRHWVNDALMALFFFVVGLEIKRELVDGELADRRRAALPVIAALGGMVLPAVLYLALNAGGEGQRGWGIPIATDIAFALGALALFARRAPASLRVFLLSVAIADDIGSIVVIAAFYTQGVQWSALLLAGASLAMVFWLWRIPRLWTDVPVAVLMVVVWCTVFAAGIHPTIAGVMLGLVTPAGSHPDPSPAERLVRTLHPWTSFVVVPLFALANAGMVIGPESIGSALSSPVTLGIVVGLVLGKLAGVSLGAYVAIRSGVGVMPSGVGWGHLVGVAGLAGIGYTVSLFIAGLSFTNESLEQQAKVGILAGSIISCAVGAVLLRRAGAAGVPASPPVTRTVRP